MTAKVSSETLRDRDRWGWLSPIRNPVTEYRCYRYKVLEKFRDNCVAERLAGA